MRKTISYLLLALIIGGVFASCRKSVLDGEVVPEKPEPPAKVVETEPAILLPVTQNISSRIQGYYKAVPAHYHETNEKYPLILFFHGGGQFGDGATEIDEVLLEGIPKMLNEKTFPPSFTVDGEPHSFIVIAPQFTKMVTTDEIPLQIDALLAHITSNFRIDTSRIYLSGFSLGGKMLTDYAAYNPAKIAAVTAMAGLPTINTDLDAKCQSMASANLPIWQFHNRDDSAWNYSEAEIYIESLNSLSPSIPPLFTTFDVGQEKLHHDCWTRTSDPEYRENGKNIYEWMLSYKR